MRLRPTLRIARWEVTAGAGGVDRRALLLIVASVAILAALVPAIAHTQPAGDAGLYRVGVDPASPYYEPVARDRQFAVAAPDERAFEAGRIELLVGDDRVLGRDTPKGRAAAAAFREAVERYNDQLMRAEADQAAAFPVTVRLRYVERDVGFVRRAPSADAGGGTDTGGADGGGAVDGSRAGDGGSGDSSRLDSGGAGDGGPATAVDPVPADQSSLFVGRQSGSPSDIAPPFPFASLVLAFAFVVPMNFVVQAYASSVLHERGNRRGEPLLVAPVSRWEIIAGKTLPYLAAMLAIAGVTALAIGGGPASLVAVAPVALLFLATGFVGALLARSHKELTFVLVTASVVVTTYVFVPAIFTQVHPIAAISPLSIVVHDLEGTAISPATVAFSTLPVTLAAGVLFALGGGMYREEDLFTQRPLLTKAIDALAGPLTSARRAALVSVLAVPFVFLAELLAVATLFVIPPAIALPVLLGIVAVVEELAKSLPVYAAFERGRFDRSIGVAAVVGAWSGAGFFVGEKLAIAAQLVQLWELDLGRAAFELGAGLGGGSTPATLAGLALVPLALHAVTAAIAATGASRGRTAYVAALAVAVFVHATYNFAVVTTLG